MYATVLRLGLWTIILMLVLYVLASAYPEEPFAELIPMPMLQQGLILGAALVVAGIVLRIFGIGVSKVHKNRCRVCRAPIPQGAMYCREHLRAILYDEDDKTHATRVRR
jgi:hypothetical protein